MCVRRRHRLRREGFKSHGHVGLSAAAAAGPGRCRCRRPCAAGRVPPAVGQVTVSDCLRVSPQSPPALPKPVPDAKAPAEW